MMMMNVTRQICSVLKFSLADVKIKCKIEMLFLKNKHHPTNKWSCIGHAFSFCHVGPGGVKIAGLSRESKVTPIINLFQTSSVLPMTKNFENDSFLLVHGTGDGKLGHIHRGLMLEEEKFHVS